MSQSKPVLTVIVASVRDGRKGRAVADWYAAEAEKHGGFEVRMADLKEIDLPLMTEPNHPRMKQYTQEKTWEWSRMIDGSDAFAFVMPEYNHSLVAPLSNAIDYLSQEWGYKPATIVCYGGVSGGQRAAQELRTRLVALSVVSMPGLVALPSFTDHIKDGAFEGYDLANTAAKDSLDAMAKWHPALKSLRQG
jgi:NAD(P)H-dependent FMN reductase